MWRIFLGALLCVLFLPAAEAATGDWDRSYGADGKLQLLIAGAPSTVAAWQPQADGKIVTAGRARSEEGYEMSEGYVISRLNADGTPDTTFDGDGVLRIAIGAGPIDTAVLADGRLLIAMLPNPYGTITLVRLNTDGSQDNTFGTAGTLTITQPRLMAFTHFHLEVAPDGAAVIVAEEYAQGGVPGIVVYRVTTAGVLDASFGSNGRVQINVVSAAIQAQAVALQSNGSIVLGGVLHLPTQSVPFIGRLTNSGQPDLAFGVNGVAELPVLEGRGFVSHLVSTAEGKIVAAGSRTDDWGNETIFIARMNADGTVDRGFGSNGRIVVPAKTVTSLSLDPDGKVVAGGTIDEFRIDVSWLARYNEDGSPDVSFGLRGRSLTDFSTGVTRVVLPLSQIKRDADGSYRALVSPFESNFGSRFALVRFAAGGSSAGLIGFHGNSESSNELLVVNERVPTYALTAYRTGGAEGAVSAQYRLVAGSATADQDFVASTGTFTFNEGEMTRTVTFQMLDDLIPEQSESFHVELFEPTGGAGLSRSRLNVGIPADFDLGSTVALVSAEVHALENAGSVRMLVQRTGDVSAELTINYATTNGSATAGADFTATSGTLTWAAGEAGVRTFDVPLLNDATVESLEQFSVTLSSNDPTAVISSTAGTAIVRIADDDDGAQTPKLGFATSSVAVAEGADSVTLQVHRIGDASQAVSTRWYTSFNLGVGASPTQDFTTSNGTLSWGAGDSAPKTLNIPILDDVANEYAEDFFVGLDVASPASPVNNVGARVIIIDNEPAPSTPLVSVGPAASFSESVGTAIVNLTMSGLLAEGTVSLSYDVVPETATASDFTLTGGTVTWSPGDPASKQLLIPIASDTLDEIDETFSIRLSTLSGGARFGRTTSSRVTIVDDDATPAGQPAPVPGGLQFDSPSVSVDENAESVVVSVRRTGDTSSALNVRYVMTGGTASSPDDYVARSGVLTWFAGGDHPQEVLIYLNGDTRSESDETFTVRFVADVPGLGSQPPVTANVTIVDDDRPSAPAQVEFVSATQSVNESATTVTLQVARSGNAAIASSVDYTTVAGSATAADFVTAAGTLTWQPNDTSSKSITLTLTPDSSDESDESFTVTLRNASAGTQIANGSATVTIVDDDGPSSPPGSGGGSGGGGGGGEESLLALLLWAALAAARRGLRTPPPTMRRH